MAVDLEEAFSRDCCWLPRRATFYLSTVWGSGAIGTASLVAGLLVADAKPGLLFYLSIIGASALLASGWLGPNSAVLIFVFAKYFRTDPQNFRSRGVFVGLESVFALLR